MKIAVTNALLPSEEISGVPCQVHDLANALVVAGHDVTVFTFSPRPPDARYRVHQYPRPKVSPRLFPFFMAYRLARTDFSAFDVVNAHGDNYLLRTPRPVVRTFHGSARDELRAAKTLRRRLFFSLIVPLEWIGARRADHVVGVSEATRASVAAVQTIIPCGVDLEAFRAGAKSEHPTVLFVGTENGRKRGAWLANVFKTEVLPGVPNAELRMVSEHAGVEDGVRRYGRVSADALSELYRSAWAFCLPSTYEGFGVPYIEAMAANTAVLATAPNPGACEVLMNGSCGSYVSDAQLGDALKRVLTDAALREDMERRGTARSRDYAWPAVAERYEHVFRTAIESKAGA